MAEGRQLPPQIKRIELSRRAGGRPVVRYQLTVDVGIVDGKRKQLRKRYSNEHEARKALDEIPATSPEGHTPSHRAHNEQGNRGLALVPPRHQG